MYATNLEDIKNEQDARQLARNIWGRSTIAGKEDGPLEKAEICLITSLLLYLAKDAPEEDRTLEKLPELLSDFGTTKALFEKLLSDSLARKQFDCIIGINPKTMSDAVRQSREMAKFYLRIIAIDFSDTAEAN